MNLYKIKSNWKNQTYKMNGKIEDVRLSFHCVSYCIMLARTQGKGLNRRPQNTWLERIQKFWRKEELNAAQLDLQFQTARCGRISVNPLHLPLEEVLPIQDNTFRLRRNMYLSHNTDWAIPASREPLASYLLQHWLCQIEPKFHEG
jgi:hypothetical protein